LPSKERRKIANFFETSSNPFYQGKSIIGLDNKTKKTPFQKRMKKLKDNIKRKRSGY